MTTLGRPLSVLLAATLALMSACAVPVTLPPPAAAPTSAPVVKQLEQLVPTAIPQPTAAPVVIPATPIPPTTVPQPTLAPTVAAPTAAPTRQSTPEVIASKVPIPPEATFFEGRVDVGGRGLFLTCKGKGSPTIVYDAGIVTRGSYLFTALGIGFPENTRVCVYDRPGVYGGYSDGLAKVRSSQDIVDDLWALLGRAGLKPPYVLIGHSFGGMNMTLLAAQHQAEVAGLILLDPLPPGTFEEWMKLLKTETYSGVAQTPLFPLTELAHGATENLDVEGSSAALNGAKSLARTPVYLVAANRPLDGWTNITDPAFKAKLVGAWKAGLAFYTRIAPRIKVTEVDEGHLLNGNASNEAATRALAAISERVRNPPAFFDEAAVLKVADSYVGPLADQNKFGGVVLIARDGEVLLNKGYGFADRLDKTPFKPESQFFIPLAEPWPALGTTMLKAQTAGKFNLDDSVCTIVADCPTHFMPVTFRLLLANAGGIPDLRFDKKVDAALFGMWFSLMNFKILPESYFAKPGAAFSSAAGPNGSRVTADLGNWAWAYIGGSVVMGADVASLHKNRVAVPVGMASSGEYRGSNDTATVALYDGSAPEIVARTNYAGHQILSAADLNKFVQALFNGTLLTPAELQEMLKPMVKVDTMPGDMSYGLGVYVGTDPAGHKVVSQVDVRQGFGAYWAYYPDSKLTVIVMNNLTDWANQPYRARDIGLLLARVILAAK